MAGLQSVNKAGDSRENKLFLIKLVHTIIWAMFVLVIFYIWYAGISNQINVYTWVAIGSVIVEGLVLMMFNGKCPLTVIGHKYTDNHQVGFDIFLPRWLAQYNKMIFGSLYAIGLLVVIHKVI